MKAIYLFIRGICLIFIGLGKLIAFLFYGLYYDLEHKMLRAKYWEDRVLCITAISIYGGAMMLWLPLWLSFLYHDFTYMCLMMITGCLVWITGGVGIGDAYKNTSKEDKIDLDDLMWGYKDYIPNAKSVKRISLDEDDPDFKQGMKEVNNHLNPEKNWEKRLKNAPALIKK